MPALNFTVFVDKVESGEKRQTIRPVRKRPIKPGDKLYLYTGMRHKNCRKLGEAICEEVEKIEIYRLTGDLKERVGICLKDNILPFSDAQATIIAISDGFNSFEKFSLFFIKTYKIEELEERDFDLIRWRDFKPAGAV